MEQHVVTLNNIMQDHLNSVHGHPVWVQFVRQFCAEAVTVIVQTAGPNFEAEMLLIGDERDEDAVDRERRTYGLLLKYAPDRHAHLCDVLRGVLIKVFDAELADHNPTLGEKISADFARLVLAFNQPYVLANCLNEYRLFWDLRYNGHHFDLTDWYSLELVLNEIDVGNEIRWLLKLTA